jgi:hypothetical protein
MVEAVIIPTLLLELSQKSEIARICNADFTVH